MPPRSRSSRSAVAALLATGLLTAALSACGSSGHSGSPPPSASATSSGGSSGGSGGNGGGTSTTATQVPTTDPGADLKVGQAATVQWTAKQGLTGLIRIKVTGLESTTYKQTFSGWKIPSAYQTRTPYFIRARVKNVGDTKLGGYDAPLYGVDSADDLVEATSFGSDFAACEPKTLPAKFGPGKSANVCLVVLVPDQNKLVGASYRPDEKFDPITWTGPVIKYLPGTHTQPNQKPNKKPGKGGKKH